MASSGFVSTRLATILAPSSDLTNDRKLKQPGEDNFVENSMPLIVTTRRDNNAAFLRGSLVIEIIDIALALEYCRLALPEIAG